LERLTLEEHIQKFKERTWNVHFGTLTGVCRIAEIILESAEQGCFITAKNVEGLKGLDEELNKKNCTKIFETTYSMVGAA